ncbi:MAG: hypothetical protein HN350_10470 [Phycisphaerales bacterium]|jgi:hypothetical protein|nr:hypothetical protein [Phycisphaerales bacterium]
MTRYRQQLTSAGSTSWRWMLSAAAVCVMVLTPIHAVMAEIPAGPDVPLIKEYRQKSLAFQRRMLVDSYKRIGVKNELWDDRVLAFLEGVAQRSSTYWDAMSKEEIVRRGLQIYIDGCDDPLFLYEWSRFLSDTDHRYLARWALNESFPGLVKRGYPQFVQAWAASKIWRKTAKEDAEKKKYYLDAMITAAGQALRNGTYRKDERDVLLEHFAELLDLSPGAAGDRLLKTILSTPKLDPLVREFALGKRHVEQAWEARGSGWASTVTEEGWAKFKEHIAKAEQHLTAAWKIDPKSHHAPELMIQVTRGSRIWFDRAVTARFDHELAYERRRWFLYPRWGGSHSAMYAFGLDCMKTGRYDTQTPYELINVLREIVIDQGMDFSFLRSGSVYENAKKVLTSYITATDSAKHRHFYRTTLMCFAVRTRHWDDARQILDTMKKPPDERAIRSFGLLPSENIVGVIRSFTGKIGPTVLKANALRTQGKYDEAIKLYETTMLASKEPSVRTYLLSAMQRTLWRKNFATGRWVMLNPDRTLNGWLPAIGHWTVDKDGALIGRNTYKGAVIWCNVNFGSSFELKATLEVLDAPYQLSKLGLAFGPRDNMSNSPRWHNCHFVVQSQKVLLGRNWGGNEAYDASVKHLNTLRVQKNGNMVSVWLNDKNVCMNQPLPHYVGGEIGNVGIHCPSGAPGMTVRASDIQVRILR